MEINFIRSSRLLIRQIRQFFPSTLAFCKANLASEISMTPATAALLTIVTFGRARANRAPLFQGIGANTKTECADEGGPNTRTLIDMGNKVGPFYDSYEHHCRILGDIVVARRASNLKNTLHANHADVSTDHPQSAFRSSLLYRQLTSCGSEPDEGKTFKSVDPGRQGKARSRSNKAISA